MNVVIRGLGFWLLALLSTAAWCLDHKDAPLINQENTADLGDLFVFDTPSMPNASLDRFSSNTVLALTTNSLSVPTEPAAFQFSDDVRYQIHIDSDGRFPSSDPNAQAGVGDISFIFTFTDISFDAAGIPSQKVLMRLKVGGTNGKTLFKVSAPVTLPTPAVDPAEPNIVEFRTPFGVGRLFAGPRDDHSFADAVSFGRVVAPQLPSQVPIRARLGNADTFGGLNVSAMVVDFPLRGLFRYLGIKNTDIQVWSTAERRQKTLRRASSGELQLEIGPFEQVDRTGNPLLNSLVVPPSLPIPFPQNPSGTAAFRDLVNVQRPLDDLRFQASPLPSLLDVTIASIRAFGVSPDLASDKALIKLLSKTLIPDTLKFSLVGSPGPTRGWPFNGRRLEDDAVDLLFAQVIYPNGLGGGFIADDLPANDVRSSNSFPFLAPPNQPL